VKIRIQSTARCLSVPASARRPVQRSPFRATSDASLFWPILGAVRFFLALVVVGAHLVWFDRSDEVGRQLGMFSGIVAVIGFLVLSGFSIAASLERERAGFYARRFRRIFPLYALAIASAWAVPAFFGGAVVTREGATFSAPDLAPLSAI
jgi:peptidoglycan/LPS O-acetylase OafA/YrhL